MLIVTFFIRFIGYMAKEENLKKIIGLQSRGLMQSSNSEHAMQQVE